MSSKKMKNQRVCGGEDPHGIYLQNKYKPPELSMDIHQ